MKHLLQYLKKGLRYDGRKIEELRELSYELNVSETAEGSARVKLGESEVIVGVKLSIEKPFPDVPDKGMLLVNAELLPLSSPDFESGPPGIESIELARVVDRGLRESEAVDMEKLCVEPGEKVWSVSIDICPINHDGNLLDAAGIGALLALKTARFPKLEENGKVNYKEMTDKGLPILKQPIPVTVSRVGEYLLVDLTKEEEENIDARLTITVTEDGRLCALQKGGNGALSIDEISKMIDIAIEKSKEIRSKLE